MQLRQSEQFQCQRIAIAVELGDITAFDQPVEHAVELVGIAAERLGDFRLRQPAIDTGEQFENVEPLVERGRAILVEIVRIHDPSSPSELSLSYTHSATRWQLAS